MNILVTGIAGFVGSHVARALIAEGHSVVGVDDLNTYYDPALKRARLSTLPSATFYEADIADTAALEKIFAAHQFDAVCHLAAQAGVRYSIENPFAYAHSNYVGSLNVFELAKRHGIGHVVFASSSSVYGNSPVLPFTENDPCSKQLSTYAASKRAGELLAQTYCQLFGMDITALRFFTVYGPWGRPDMALFSFTKKLLAGEPIELYNGGDMKRDFTYVDDIVSGFVLALTTRPKGYEVFNLGRGESVSLRDFVSALEEALGVTAQIIEKPMQAGDMKETSANVDKARKVLGFDPKVSLKEGVANFVSWYRGFYNV